MSRRTVQLGNRIILFSPDDPVPPVNRIQAVMKVRVTDELTGTAPDGRITLEVKERGFFPRLGSDGLGGLSGIPHELFPALQARDYPVHLTISAERYESREIEKDVPQDLSFPATFTPPEIDVALHRRPVFIAGRTARLINNASTPVAGAQIRVTGIWRTPPPANVAVAPDPPNLVSLQPPLYSDRAAVTQFLRSRDLLAVLGNDKILVDDLPPRANPIRLSNRQGLAPGNILLIDAEQPDLAEFIAIKTLPTTAPADQPALVTLDYPLIFAHRRGAIVRRVNPQPAGANRQFTVSAFSGDTCVFLDALTGLAAAHEMEITGAPGPNEFHKVVNFSVMSDADGYYRLPPLSRVAQLEIHAEKTVGAQTFKATTTFRPDYQRRENGLDFTLAV
ncbi:MAG: hypothetical protein ACREUU_19615 [Gammaproteobacteria bacterium]